LIDILLYIVVVSFNFCHNSQPLSIMRWFGSAIPRVPHSQRLTAHL